MASEDYGLYRLRIPIPNRELGEWLVGAECKAKVTEITTEVFVAYRSTLPVITGNLQAGAGMDVQLGGWGAKQDRWFGYVYNNALSYRKTRGKPYAGTIEYGQRRRGIPGQHQLERAAEIFGGQIGAAGGVRIPGIARDRGGRLRDTSTGHFTDNPVTPRRRRRRRP